MKNLKVDLGVGEALRLDGGRICVTLVKKSGQRARISIEADESVSIQVPRRESGGAAPPEKMVAGTV